MTSPLQHTTSKLKNLLDEKDYPYADANGDSLYVELTMTELSSLSNLFRDRFSQRELRDTKILWKGQNSDLTLDDLSQMLSLNTFLNRINAQWLIDILKENKLYTVYQPIVKASDPGSIYGYECLLRAVGSEEDSINPEKLFSAAEDSELIFQLDRDARITAIENINSVEDDVTFFINFRTSSIYDPEYCLRSTIEAMEETDINPSHFTFEVVESKNVKDKQFISGIIEKYRDSGVNVSLDDLGANEDSLELMKELEPDYVKFESDLTKVVRENSIDSDLIEPITTEASELGILTMAKGIESEYEHNWFKERGVDLLQGNYFYTPSGAPEPQHSS